MDSSSIRHSSRILLFLALASIPAVHAQRITLSLNGTWQAAESLGAEEAETAFDRTAPIPGLARLAAPVFLEPDRFDVPAYSKGTFRPLRNYFWFRTSFRAPARHAVAWLAVKKAQFGIAVWLNGRRIGESNRCFTANYFDMTSVLHWDSANELVIRVGAHPGVLPASVPCGRDGEKKNWTAGIYDDVSAIFTGAVSIETVQAAPRVNDGEILVQTRIRNAGAACEIRLLQRIKTWKEGHPAANPVSLKVVLAAGEARTLTQRIKLPHATLWSPDNPFLYVLETETGTDRVSTRFGMREFRFDTPTRRAYLNGKPIYLRGSNITLHRFFEDPKCGDLPWTEPWVRKLLTGIPKRFHWNAFRFCIGPVPDRWLEIADEAGLLIQNEYFIWGYRNEWSTGEVIAQFKDWMRDNWNHPSVVIWDASNETRSDVLTREVIPAVRSLDLSNRPWENGYNLPGAPDDPVENHPYENFRTDRPFELIDLETSAGSPLKLDGERTPATAHAMINNEYCSFWLTRDGDPTYRTQPKYDRLLPHASREQRLEFYAYLLGGLTEYWRAHRNFAAVLHFVLLTASSRDLVTSDSFRDVITLELDPHFESYVQEAFKPLGVYLRFWRPALKAGSMRRFEIMMINDEDRLVQGELKLALQNSDSELSATAGTAFAIPAFGAQTYELELPLSKSPGEYWLRASATETGKSQPTVSRRKVRLEPQ